MADVTHEQYMRGLDAYRGDKSIRSVQKELGITWHQALDLVEHGMPGKGLEPYEEVVCREMVVAGRRSDEQDGVLLNAKDDLKANIILYKTMQKAALDYYKPDEDSQGEKITIKELRDMVKLGQELAALEASSSSEALLLPYEDITDQEFNDFALGKKKPRR